MKATLLFATLTMVLAAPRTFATTELEALRERCARQEQEIRKLEEQVRKTQPESVRATPSAKSTPAVGSYTVRSGDSLERIARRNGCSATSLVKANGLRSSSVIHPGQKLKIPGKATIAQTTTPAPTATAAIAPMKPSVSTHKIAQGETFASISRKHRVPLASLMAANPEVKPTALRPGQVIRLSAGSPASKPATELAAQTPAPRSAKPASAPVHRSPQTAPTTIPISTRETTSARTPAPAVTAPVSSPSPSTAEVAASTPPPAAASQGTSLSPNPEKKIRSVTIEGEMSYGEFAAKHGTDTERLNDLNGLDLTHATVLAKGSELYVPAQP